MNRILLISSDLQARARVEAAARASGLEYVARGAGTGRPADAPAAETVVLDMDELGEDLPGWVDWARRDDPARRVVGFFAHVQEATGALGRELGIEVYRRGRFWRELRSVLARPG